MKYSQAETIQALCSRSSYNLGPRKDKAPAGMIMFTRNSMHGNMCSGARAHLSKGQQHVQHGHVVSHA